MINKISDSENLDNEIDLREFKLILKNNWLFVFLFTLVFGALGFCKSYFGKTIYKGEFQIVLEDKNKLKNSPIASLSSVVDTTSLFGINSSSRSLQTEIGILESPLVLKPIFEYFVDSKKKKGEDLTKLTFQDWKRSLLEIKLLNKTSILNISYQDEDKDFILKILDKISKSYQNYSKLDRTEDINNAINYLTKSYLQAQINSKDSTDKLQKFAINNRLGNLDGMPYKLGNYEGLPSSNKVNKNYINEFKENEFTSQPYQSTGRYKNHYAKLQELESEYDRLSALLLPNSQILKEIKFQIDTLNERLKRPNEIIAEFRELLRNASNDEAVLQNIDIQLRSLELEKAKQSKPWSLISNPSISNKTVTLSLKRSTAYASVIGLILSITFILLRDLLFIERIYTKEKFEKYISFPYLKSINIKDEKDQEEIIKILNKNVLNVKEGLSYGILILSEDLLEDLNLFLEKFKKLSNQDFLITNNLMKLENCEEVILITYSNSISIPKLTSFMEKIELCKLNIKGWLFLSL